MFWSTLSGKIILGLMIILIVSLQYAYWLGEHGHFAQQKLQHQIEEQQLKNQELAESNRILAAEVYDLKNGAEAIEEHARLDLGLIKPYETFVQYDRLIANQASQNTASAQSLPTP